MQGQQDSKKGYRLNLAGGNSGWVELASLPDGVFFPGAAYLPAATTTTTSTNPVSKTTTEVRTRPASLVQLQRTLKT
jgi:hypothetical protein